MSFISSTVDKVLAIAVAALLVLCVAFGGLWWYRGTVIDKQDAEIATQKIALDAYAKDKAAQDKADKQLQADKEKIAKELDKFKKNLHDAIKDNECANAPIPDDAKRLLQELYNSQGS
jgi:hypothetical protein